MQTQPKLIDDNNEMWLENEAITPEDTTRGGLRAMVLMSIAGAVVWRMIIGFALS